MSYLTAIRELISKMAPDVLPEQVYVGVDAPSKLVSLKWQTSMLLTSEQRVTIAARAQALLPASLRAYRVSVV